MDKEIIQSTEVAENIIEKPQKKFKGYTMDELRYQRAMTALQKEFAKQRISHRVRNLRNYSIFGKNSSSKMTKIGNVATKLISGASYIDYAMIGYSLFNSGKKIFSIFSKKK